VKSQDRKLLSSKQELTIQCMILDTMTDQFKLPYALWIRKGVKELVKRELANEIALTTGYSPQKPKKEAYEHNLKAIQRWLDQEYPAIKEKTKQENEEIHWGDETGVRNNNQHGRSYAPKGNTPTKKSMSKPFSVNMFSSATRQGRIEFMNYTDNINADRFIKFLEQLIISKSKKKYLILDNLRVHHSKTVKQWVEEHKEHIALFYLPSYSPDKNADEYLNCVLKQVLSSKPSPRNQEKLSQNLKNHKDLLQINTQRIKNISSKKIFNTQHNNGI
jgi:transposase